MSNISRLFTFLSGQPASAVEVNAELDQLITTINTGRVHADGTQAMSGHLLLPNSDPTLPNHSTRKSYTDALVTTHAATPHSGGGSGPTVVRKTADTSRVSTVVLADDPHLLFAMTANTNYKVRMRVLVNHASWGFACNVGGPAAATWRVRMDGVSPGNTAALGVIATLEATHLTEATTANIAMSLSSTTHDKWIDLEGIVTCGATAGDFRLKWCQNSSGAQATIVRANSFLEYQALV